MRGRLWTIVLLTPLLLAGMCEDDSPTGTGAPLPDPTLDNLWPNADGASWTYALEERIWSEGLGDLYIVETPEEVPPPPTLDQVAALLEEHPHEPVTDEDEGYFILRFDGEITTDSGVTAQNLAEVVIWTPEAVGPRAATGEALMRRILAVRPDLRARAAELGLRAAARESASRDLMEPLLLHGYAWEKTSEHIGTYGDLDQLLAWKFLESDLTIGHEFTHQLVPELADDIWLHARIIAVGTVRTPAGRFRKAVTCLYAVDYGVTQVSTQEEPLIGYARVIDYGTVSFAPAIGPVHSYERIFVSVGETGFGEGSGELEVSLTETNQAR